MTIINILNTKTEEYTNVNNIKPYQLSIGIIPKCNSKCKYCNNWKDKNSENPSPELLLDIIKSAKCLGIEQVLLSGGEPLLNPNWKEIVKGIIDIDLKYTIISNGLLLNKNDLQFLLETGCRKIGISLDTVNPETYYSIRGVPIDPVINNINRITDEKQFDTSKISICCTIHRKNIYELRELVDYCIMNNLPLQFQPIQIDINTPQKAFNEYWPNTQQIDYLSLFLKEIINYKNSQKLALNNSVEYLNKIIEYFKKGIFIPKRCLATCKQITIDQTLSLKPCWGYDKSQHISSGKELIEIWKSKDYSLLKCNMSNGKCHGCYYCCHLDKKYNIL